MAQALIARAINVSETTKHDIFVYYLPHVKEFDVDIHTNGWKSGTSCDRKIWISWDRSDARLNYEAAVKALDELAEDRADGSERREPRRRGSIAGAQKR